MMEVTRTIKREMISISSSDHDFVLKDNVEAVKNFSWDTVTLELQSKVPYLEVIPQLVFNRSEQTLYRLQSSAKENCLSVQCSLLFRFINNNCGQSIQVYCRLYWRKILRCCGERATKVGDFNNKRSSTIFSVVTVLNSVVCLSLS